MRDKREREADRTSCFLHPCWAKLARAAGYFLTLPLLSRTSCGTAAPHRSARATCRAVAAGSWSAPAATRKGGKGAGAGQGGKEAGACTLPPTTGLGPPAHTTCVLPQSQLHPQCPTSSNFAANAHTCTHQSTPPPTPPPHTPPHTSRDSTVTDSSPFSVRLMPPRTPTMSPESTRPLTAAKASGWASSSTARSMYSCMAGMACVCERERGASGRWRQRERVRRIGSAGQRARLGRCRPCMHRPLPPAHLDGAGCVHQLEEGQLAHEAARHDAPRHRHACTLRHLPLAQPRVQLLQLRRGVGAGEGVGVWLPPGCAKLLQGDR